VKKVRTIPTRSGLDLQVETAWTEDQIEVTFLAPVARPCVLHWGVRSPERDGWKAPPASLWPPGTVAFGAEAVQTSFDRQNGAARVVIRFAAPTPYRSLDFVLFFPQEKRWDNNGGQNYRVELEASPTAPGLETLGTLASLAEEILRAETHNSWTLMHRFNRCYDLLGQARGDREGLALVFVWLRFSAIRQLTWQRRYNTQPRELAHAQDRLTQKLADLYRSERASRPLLRLILTTVGRGGEGQRIRDEILQIMHRHHVKEVSGHFLEEWHQKLHNNTTPDDVVICAAYLEFLRSNGNADRFYQVLSEGNVSRQRLESFERPIRSRPDFVGHLKEGLIHDFEQFLRILKAAHCGTDFETAFQAARGRLDGHEQGLMNWIAGHRHEGAGGVVNLAGRISEVRRRIASRLEGGEGLRELLYLDLALEQELRGAVERNLHLHLSGDALAELIGLTLENLGFAGSDAEMAAGARLWNRLLGLPRFGAEWSLRAKAAADHIGNALGEALDRLYRLLQPKAELLGRGFQAEAWSINLFSEEVVRGSSLGFALSMLLGQLGPILRQSARLGAWQVVSPGQGFGHLEVVASLQSVQRRAFSEPVVLVTDQVKGDEDIPEGVTAVLTPGATDLVSHVAVRARNAKVLFATCYDPEVLAAVKAWQGRLVKADIDASGEVRVAEAAVGDGSAGQVARADRPVLQRRPFTQYALTMEEFNERSVGGKSRHLAELRGKLPDWILLPASAALPFGVFERVLGLRLNQEIKARYEELAKQAEEGSTETLAALRETVLSLAAPEELKAGLRAAMARAGLPWPEDWTKAWRCVLRVWASKWNDRAFLSRRKLGIPHDDLCMAVLIQEVAAADYAFVIHTVNPVTGRRDELLAEVVLGLGETLVGNYPGRALTFVCDKVGGPPTVLSFPAKSAALYGGGLIFRSDSNGEDLAGYAGAGLYDSVLLEEPRRAVADYSGEPLVWDAAFQRELLAGIARLGAEVERACGTAQDIEGAIVGSRFYLVQTRPQAGAD